MERYLQVIRYKTAKLSRRRPSWAPCWPGVDAATEEAAAEYGRRIGTAFQLIDDMLDYTASAEQMGKNAGDDLREGKPTLPLLHLLEHGTAEQRALAREAIVQGGTEHFDAVFAAIHACGALEVTFQAAQREADAAEKRPGSSPTPP
ncbi:polyprenyl synthetase family protein [Cupriavidus basilensis]